MSNPITTRTAPVTLSDGRIIPVRELNWVEITELSTLLIAEFQCNVRLIGQREAA